MKIVLIADDNESSRELVRAVLENCGVEVREATDGAEALACIRKQAPDLVLLDVHMPILDGFGVVRELRSDKKYADLPVVALTASAMQGDRERALSLGFTEYLTKPISLGILRSRLLSLLRDEN